MAINREAIQRVVMRTQSVPAGAIVPPFVNGYTKELDALPRVDVAKAKALLAEAGYPNGFSVSLHCPNDRYLNDEAICQAAVGMLGQIGIKVNLVSQSKSLHFPVIQKAEADFYLLGWGVPPYDSEYIFNYLYHTRTDKFGGWNATRYSNPEIDKLIEGLSAETDLAKRNAAIAKIWQQVAADQIYVAIHHQVLAHAMKNFVDIPVHPDNQVFFKLVKLPQVLIGTAHDRRLTASDSGHIGMIAYLLRSLAQAVVVMLAVALIAFAMFRFVGDPVASMVGQEASVAERTELAERLGLDDPVPVQFGRFVLGIARGELRHLVPAGPPGGRSDRRTAAGDRRARGAVVAAGAGAGDRARRLRGDQSPRRPRECRDVVVAPRREPADLPDRDRPDLSVRGRAALAAVVRPRRGRAVRLVVDRAAHRLAGASR